MNNGVQIFRDNLFMNEAYTFILIKIELKALNEYFLSFFSFFFSYADFSLFLSEKTKKNVLKIVIRQKCYENKVNNRYEEDIFMEI